MNAVSRAGIKRTREGAGRTSEVGQPDITPILGTPARPWQSERPVAHSRVLSPHLANGDIYVADGYGNSSVHRFSGRSGKDRYSSASVVTSRDVRARVAPSEGIFTSGRRRSVSGYRIRALHPFPASTAAQRPGSAREESTNDQAASVDGAHPGRRPGFAA